MKIFFRFPELLLPVAVLLTPVFVGNTTIDIQLHDTYYVFGGTTWGANVLFVPIFILLMLSWLTHVIGRKYHLLSVRWQWVQVGATLLCLAVIVKIISSLLFRGGTGFVGFDEPSWRRFHLLSQILTWTTVIFISSQVIFWIWMTLLAVRKATTAKKSRSTQP